MGGGAHHNSPAERSPRRQSSAKLILLKNLSESTETTSKFWGVAWDKSARRWKAEYTDANHKRRTAGYHDTEEAAAHAVNAAIGALPPDDVKRHTNPVVEGQLVPKPSRNYQPSRKRPRVVDPAAAPTRWSARRSRQE